MNTKLVLFGIAFLVSLALLNGSASATTYDCSSCIDCQNYAKNASAGDVVEFMNDMTTTGDCILASDVANITIDCVGHSITYIGGAGHDGMEFDWMGTGYEVVVRNCIINDFNGSTSNGIGVRNHVNFTIENCTFDNNYMAIDADRNHNNVYNLTIRDVTITNSVHTDIYLGHGTNSTNIYDTTMSGTPSNAHLLVAKCQTNGIFENISISGSSPVGIDFYSSPGESCGSGAPTYNNTLSHSRIEGATVGIDIANSVFDNLFYDNYFNNTDNVANSSVVSNDWNIALQSGTSVIGGYYIGGNYWANPSGTGYSDTCTDTTPADGICDTPFEVTSYDNLPLTTPIPPIDFEDEGWQGCKDVQINLTDGQALQNVLIYDLNVTGLTYNDITELALSDSACGQSGFEVTYQIWDNSSNATANGDKWAVLMWQDSYTTNTTYSVWYDRNTTYTPNTAIIASIPDLFAFNITCVDKWSSSQIQAITRSDHIEIHHFGGAAGANMACLYDNNATTKAIPFNTDELGDLWYKGYTNTSSKGDTRACQNADLCDSGVVTYFPAWGDFNTVNEWTGAYDNKSTSLLDFVRIRFSVQTPSGGHNYLFLYDVIFCDDCNVSDNITSSSEDYVFPIVNTTIPSVKFNVSDFSFSSSSYVTASNMTFNSTASETTYILVSSLNVKAETGNGTRDVYGRLIVDGTIIQDQKIRTISGAYDEGVTGLDPTLFNVSTGEHYIQLDFKRDGSDSVEVNDIDIVLLKINASDESELRFQVTPVDYSHDSPSYTPAFIWNVDTYYFGKFTLTANGTATGSYYYQNLNTTNTSAEWKRYIKDENDTGSVSGIWLDPNETVNTHAIMSHSSGSNISVQGVITEFDLTTNSNENINAFYDSHPYTYVGSTLTYNSAGVHTLAYGYLDNSEGDSAFIGSVISFKSSDGNVTPYFWIESPNLTQSQCYSKKERYLESTDDIGNVYIYTICTGLTQGEQYRFELKTNLTGDFNLTVYDEAISGFEATAFNISAIYLPPIPNAIISPSNASTVSGSTAITWLPFFDPNDDLLYYDVIVYNSDATYNATDGNTSNTTYDLDTSVYGSGDFIVGVQAVDSQNFTGESRLWLTFDNSPPVITIVSPTNITYTTTLVTLSITTDESATIVYSLNGAVNVSYTTPIVTSSPVGLDNIVVYATDVYSNMNSAQIYYTVDVAIIDDRALAGAILVVLVLAFAIANLIVSRLMK